MRSKVYPVISVYLLIVVSLFFFWYIVSEQSEGTPWFVAVAFPIVTTIVSVRLLANYASNPTGTETTYEGRAVFIAVLVYLTIHIEAFSVVYRSTGLRDMAESGHTINNGLISLYFSIITITTVGYGDYAPINTVSRFTAGFEALTGYFILAFAVAAIPNFLRSTQSAAPDKINRPARAIAPVHVDTIMPIYVLAVVVTLTVMRLIRKRKL